VTFAGLFLILALADVENYSNNYYMSVVAKKQAGSVLLGRKARKTIS
jgi:hypothetical protein